MLETPLLRLRSASKSFGVTRALQDVDLTIESGEVHMLLGQNGSGKSTLIKILAGYHVADDGTELEIGGVPVSTSGHDNAIESASISFVHQDLGLIDTLSIVDNFSVVRWRREHRMGLRRLRWRGERARARKALAAFGIHHDVDRPVGELREGDRAIVAIVRALSMLAPDTPSVLVLDEPTAALPRHEAELLFAAVRRLRAQGHGVLFVSHRLEEVRALGDKITVLRDGKLAWSGGLDEVTDSDLVDRIVGHKIAASARPTRAAHTGEVALSLVGVSGDTTRDVSLGLHAGEVVGLTGLAGMGQDEIPALLLGLVPAREGELAVNGKGGQPRSPRAALAEGIAYLAPSRAKSALATASVADNVTMPVLTRYFSGGRLDRRRELGDVGKLVEAFDVRPAAPAAPMASLSGGNQQKVLLARLQHSQARILLLHEPTHGIDVGAREQVLETIDRMRDEGRAILLISNEYEDLERVCDRVLVFGDGCVHEELTGDAVGETAIAGACLRASLLDGAAAA